MFHKKYFIPLWRTIKPNIIYGKEGRCFLSLHICVGNPRRAKRNRILRAVRKRVYRWDWDGPDIMKAFTSANVQQTLWNVRNFRSYAASNLATVDAPGCDYFVLRKNPSVLYICQLRMSFMRRRWRVYVVEGEYVQNVWYIISAWALFVVRSTVQGKCESLEGGTTTKGSRFFMSSHTLSKTPVLAEKSWRSRMRSGIVVNPPFVADK